MLGSLRGEAPQMIMTDAAKGQGLVVLPGVAKRMDDLIGSAGAELDITAIAPKQA